MAFVEISSQRVTSSATGVAASKTATFPGNVTAGNFIVIGGSCESGSNRPVITVSGGGGPDPSDIVTIVSVLATGGSGLTFAFLSVAYVRTTGSCTVTNTMSTAGGAAASAYGNFSMTEFTGAGGLVGLRQAFGSSTSPSPGALEVLDTDLLLGVVGWNASSACTEPAGWTLIGENQSWAADTTHHFAFKIATATGTETPVWTLGGSAAWVSMAGIVRDFGGGGGGGGGGVSRARVVNG